MALQALERAKESEAAYRNALKHSPEYTQALSKLGVVLQCLASAPMEQTSRIA